MDCAQSVSRVQLRVTLWIVARQAPLTIGFYRQEYWSGLLCPLPRDIPDPGIEPESLLLHLVQVGSLPLAASGKSFVWITVDFPEAQMVKNVCSAQNLGAIPGLGRAPGEGNGNPLQYCCLENPMDRRAWRATLHRVRDSWTRLLCAFGLPSLCPFPSTILDP